MEASQGWIAPIGFAAALRFPADGGAPAMTCQACGTENDPGRKFCMECGAALARTCPSCGTSNPAASKFCGECGSALTGAAEAPTGSQP